jgi:HK97 family phage major capsid protein
VIILAGENYIPRYDVDALMPEEYSRDIVDSVPEMSAVMRLGYKAQNMSRKQRRIPCVSALPITYFENPGPGTVQEGEQWKKLSRMAWENKYLDAEGLNVIIVIPEAVLNDSAYDIWAEVKPKLLEAFGAAFDQAVFYGVDAPAIWPTPIVQSAIAAGNSVVMGSLGDIYADILGVNGLISKVEEDGYFCDGHVCAMKMRSYFRGLRATTGEPIFKALVKEGVQGATVYKLDGDDCIFPRNGSIIPDLSMQISGDWRQLMYAIREDVSWKLLDQAVLQDPVTKEIVINLPQQNAIALRATMRVAWQVPNPINRLNTDETTRYPFAVYHKQGS